MGHGQKIIKIPVDTVQRVPYFACRLRAVTIDKKAHQSLRLFRKEGEWGVVFCRFAHQDEIGIEYAHVAQLVEHILGKDEVISSILIMGSRHYV